MGDKHPAEPKVIMEFTIADLNLSPVSSNKLIKLVGPRFNPAKGLVKLSCEMFETQAQNKRYLSDLLDKLLTEAKVYLHSLFFLNALVWGQIRKVNPTEIFHRI